jgi:hypothetical protein
MGSIERTIPSERERERVAYQQESNYQTSMNGSLPRMDGRGRRRRVEDPAAGQGRGPARRRRDKVAQSSLGRTTNPKSNQTEEIKFMLLLST